MREQTRAMMPEYWSNALRKCVESCLSQNDLFWDLSALAILRAYYLDGAPHEAVLEAVRTVQSDRQWNAEVLSPLLELTDGELGHRRDLLYAEIGMLHDFLDDWSAWADAGSIVPGWWGDACRRREVLDHIVNTMAYCAAVEERFGVLARDLRDALIPLDGCGTKVPLRLPADKARWDVLLRSSSTVDAPELGVVPWWRRAEQ